MLCILLEFHIFQKANSINGHLSSFLLGQHSPFLKQSHVDLVPKVHRHGSVHPRCLLHAPAKFFHYSNLFPCFHTGQRRSSPDVVLSQRRLKDNCSLFNSPFFGTSLLRSLVKQAQKSTKFFRS